MPGTVEAASDILLQVIFIILSGFVTYYASIGGLRHLFYLQPEQQALAVKYNWITQPWAIFGFATGKISVALLILRLIGPNTVWRKWILYVSMVSVLIFNSVDCIITFAQCDPPRALWTPELIVSGEAKCWDSTVQADYAIFLSGERSLPVASSPLIILMLMLMRSLEHHD